MKYIDPLYIDPIGYVGQILELQVLNAFFNTKTFFNQNLSLMLVFV